MATAPAQVDTDQFFLIRGLINAIPPSMIFWLILAACLLHNPILRDGCVLLAMADTIFCLHKVLS